MSPFARLDPTLAAARRDAAWLDEPPPHWLAPGDGLHRAFAVRRELVQSATPMFAWLVQSSADFAEPGADGFVAWVCTSARAFTALPDRLERLADSLREDLDAKLVAPALTPLRRMLKDDSHAVLLAPVPRAWSGGAEVHLAVTILRRAWLAGGVLPGPFAPLLVSSRLGCALFPPTHQWPTELREANEAYRP